MSFPFKVIEHTIPGQHLREWPRATANSQNDVLHIHVKQYMPIANPDPRPGDVTIIGAHANGLPKEAYEALWMDLEAKSGQHGFRIRGIWIADVAHQGYSGRANGEMLGNDPSGYDDARDLLHMTNVFRAEMPRPIVGVAHSYGGCVVTQLALLHNRLFTSLVLLDPSINDFSSAQTGLVAAFRASALRPDRWPSREAADKAFRRSRMYSSWDPRVLDAWLAHGIQEASDKSAELKTPRHQEASVFFRPLHPHINADGTVDREGAPDYAQRQDEAPDAKTRFPFYRGEGVWLLDRLPNLRPSVLWIFGKDSAINLPPSSRAATVESCGTGINGSGGIEAGKVSSIHLAGHGHWFPLEAPEMCAEHVAEWLGKEMQLFQKADREYQDWARRPLHEKTAMSSQTLEAIGVGSSGVKKEPRGDKSKSKL